MLWKPFSHLMWIPLLVVLTSLRAEAATNGQDISVSVACVEAPFLDLQKTKGPFLSVAPTGETVKIADLSPLLCIVVLKNQSTNQITIHSPVDDLLGCYAIQMEFTEGGRVFRRCRDGVNPADILASRLDVARVNFRTLRTLGPGDSLAIPISLAEFWPPELGHIYRAPSNTLVRAVYRLHDTKNEKATVEMASTFVDLQSLLTDRVEAYTSRMTPVPPDR